MLYKKLCRNFVPLSMHAKNTWTQLANCHPAPKCILLFTGQQASVMAAKSEITFDEIPIRG